jgi:polyisoprenoid-binding protein YceI
VGAVGSRRLRRGLVGAGIATILLVGAAVAGAVIVLGSHHAPAPLSLSSPSPATAPSGLAGTWKVTTGSEAGYRAREQFINQPAATEAVARTSKVSGSLVIQDSGSSLKITSVHFTVDLSTLQSRDSYAMYQVYQRDFFVKTIYLHSDVTPNAEFVGDPASLPADIGSGPITLKATGKLTVHGVTKQVTTQLKAQLNGKEIEIVGSISVDMRDFGIEVPDISFTRAEPGVTIEYHLLLARG